jgi:hypothetical protein
MQRLGGAPEMGVLDQSDQVLQAELGNRDSVNAIS